jgi:hypothetical protein
VEAVRALASILARMQSHQEKKRHLLQPMEIAKSFFDRRPGGEGDAGSSTWSEP